MDFPPSHVTNSLVLTGAEPEIDLWELSPSDGTGLVCFKADNSVTWLGTLYYGLPMSFTGEKDAGGGNGGDSPVIELGQENLDLSLFKPLIRNGSLDNAVIVRKTVLLADMLANLDVKVVRSYRIGVVTGYSRTKVSLMLRHFSGARRATIPFRQYLPPAFPHVSV